MYMTSTESTCISDMPRRLRGGEEEETKVNYAKMQDLIKTLTEMPKEDEEKIESWKEDNFRKKQEEKTEEEKRVESLSPEEYEKNVENEWLRDLEIDFVVFCNNFCYMCSHFLVLFNSPILQCVKLNSITSLKLLNFMKCWTVVTTTNHLKLVIGMLIAWRKLEKGEKQHGY